MARTSNLIEGILWIIIGVCFLIPLLRPAQRRAKLIAAANFIAFGLSDFVEMHTGAWWRPWWLLVWKGICVIAMLGLLIAYLRRRRSRAANRRF